MSVRPLDSGRLDDPATRQQYDVAEMLRAVATSAAQVRSAARAAAETDLEPLVGSGRPRAIVVVGMGGSGIAGDVLSAVVGLAGPLPVFVHRGYGLPGWVGSLDLVVAVSCSGRTEETLAATDEAIRRGAALLAVGAADSPLAYRAEQARGIFLPAPSDGRQPRANLWALATPLVVVAAAFGLASSPDAIVEATAQRLERVALVCRPDSETFVNPAKDLALELAGSLPIAWGTTPVAAVAAGRLATQLAENAKSPAIAGALPEALHNQVVTFDGPWAPGPEAIFDDPETRATHPRLRLVLLRDPTEHPEVAMRADVSRELAADRGIPVTELTAEGGSAYERLASLVGPIDYASVYLALLLGIDPTPIGPIDALKARLRG